jgi:hypothetical protein
MSCWNSIKDRPRILTCASDGHVTPTRFSQDTRHSRLVGVAYLSRGHRESMRRVRVVARSILRLVRARDQTVNLASAVGRSVQRVEGQCLIQVSLAADGGLLEEDVIPDGYAEVWQLTLERRRPE